MPRSHASHRRADEIVAQLMDVVVGLTRRARSDYAGQTLPYRQHAVLKRLERLERHERHGRLGKESSWTTADLARAELMTPQAMGGLVATLEDAGHVTRRDDAEDARRRLVTLTAAGRKVLAANRAARHRWLASLVAEQFDAEEQRTVATALTLLGKLLPPRGS